MFRIGLGYDLHRTIAGRPLVLANVVIPHEKGLDGHSDADVVLHAIGDALLGALGQGDIGEHFPNTDPQYKDISSLELLRRIYALVKKENFTVTNLDVVILAEEPQLKDYKEKMRRQIAGQLEMKDSQVNIKAATSEGMGFVGRRQGLAAYATVLLTQA